MREIAAEAGVSLRVVQYHFGSKHQLLVAAVNMLHRENERLAWTRVQYDPANLRGVLGTMLDEFLPLDAQRAMALRVFSAYYAREHPLEELVAGSSPRPRRADKRPPAWTPGGRPTCWWQQRSAWAETYCTAAAP